MCYYNHMGHVSLHTAGEAGEARLETKSGLKNAQGLKGIMTIIM